MYNKLLMDQITNNPVVYLIHTDELRDLNVRKIGCGQITGINRCITGYKKNSKIICVLYCDDVYML